MMKITLPAKIKDMKFSDVLFSDNTLQLKEFSGIGCNAALRFSFHIMTVPGKWNVSCFHNRCRL